MNIQNIIFNILLLLFFTQIASAQPGYQGKRFFVEASIATFPAFGGPTVNNRGLDYNNIFESQSSQFKDRFALNTRFGAKTSLTVGYRANIFVGFNIFNTGLIDRSLTPNKLVPTEMNTHDIFYNSSVKMVEFGVDYYGSHANSNLAPLGWHWIIGATYIFGNSKEIEHKLTYPSSFSSFNYTPYHELAEAPAHNTNFKEFAFHLGFGKRMIMFNRLIINISAESYILPSWIMYRVENNSWENADNQLVYNNAVTRRLQRHLSINLNLGLGLLIF